MFSNLLSAKKILVSFLSDWEIYKHQVQSWANQMNLSKDALISIASQVSTVTEPPEAYAYLIRILIHQQQPMLGYRRNNQLCLNDYGTVVAEEWTRSAANRKGIELDLWTVLPNGIEGIVILDGKAVPISSRSFSSHGAGQKPWVLSSFIASFKAAAAKRINLRRNQLGEPVWQRNYQEHLIPDEATLNLWRNRLRDKAG
jgi:putative transposase